ncbi:MAG: nucleotidyltransferase [Thermoanaerobaculia bacterium]
MDDPGNGPYSRAPELEDLLNLCRALNEEGVRYCLIGGFAVILHGFVRGTKDIDLLIDPDPDNVAALKRAMSYLPDNAAALLADDEVASYEVVRVADEIVVDLLGQACGVRFDHVADEGLERHAVEGVEVPVASKEVLIRTKDTIRESDHQDVRFLRARIEEERHRDGA